MSLHEHTAASIRRGPPRPQDAIAPFSATGTAYEIKGEDPIGDTLTLLAEHGDAISMYAAGSREPVLGRILSVDPELPHFVMELNAGETLAGGNVTFVASLGTAKLQFKLSKPDWTPQPSQSQLIPMVFPEVCVVLNRRAHERVETPVGMTFQAFFELNQHHYELPIFDFSLGGFGLQCTKAAAKGLLKGRKLLQVRMELGEDLEVVADLEVRFTRALHSFLLGDQLHIGCMFINRTPELDSELQLLLRHLTHAEGGAAP